MRIRIVNIILSVLFFILAMALWHIQINQFAEYSRLARNNRIRLVPIEGARGCIYDRTGKILAWNKLCFQVVCIPEEVQYKEQIFSQISQLLDCPIEFLRQNYRKNYRAPFAPLILLNRITKKQAMLLEENKLALPGVMVEVVPQREYPYKKVASHVIGYLGEIDKMQLLQDKIYGYKMKDIVGKAGIEKTYDTYLKGEDGGMQVEVDNFGRTVRVIGYKYPVKGNDIYLTIDIRMQEIAERVLGNHKGSIIVMDPFTGEMLVIASSPGFDPNIFIRPRDNKVIKTLLGSKNRPFLNRAIQGLYPPGSIFKIVTASAGLQTHKIDPRRTIFCSGKMLLGGRTFPCWYKNGHQEVDMLHALKYSCNIYFFSIGRLVGIRSLLYYASRFGFGKTTGIELPQESAGFVAYPGWKMKKKKMPWWEGDTCNFSIGQGYLLTTPLQNAIMIAIIANGGHYVKPCLVKQKGASLVDCTFHPFPVGLADATMVLIRDGLSMVVNDSDGTGRLACPSHVKIAGKTGTAQVGAGQLPHAWFVGYTRENKRPLSFVVMIEHGGSGGRGPSEMVRELINQFESAGLCEKDF